MRGGPLGRRREVRTARIETKKLVEVEASTTGRTRARQQTHRGGMGTVMSLQRRRRVGVSGSPAQQFLRDTMNGHHVRRKGM